MRCTCHIVSMFVLGAMCVLQSCGSHRALTATLTQQQKSPATEKSSTVAVKTPHDKPSGITSSRSMNTISQLIREAEDWLGTPYLYGGNDRDGVDCSGFVSQVYKCAMSVTLPRSSRQQCSYCVPVSRDELKAGDLVFFTYKESQEVGHVGIYIGEGQMIHASSSKGVVKTSINTPYYQRNFHSAGRVPCMANEKSPTVKSSYNVTEAKSLPQANEGWAKRVKESVSSKLSQ